MSAENENVFARWSRRKQAMRQAATPTAEGDERIAEAVSAAEPDELPVTAEAEATGPAEPLPRIEDLTAESDLSAFLRKGVPAALKSAAMRKMWSLDPAIRDYIGPSEYAWDFNQAGSMPGFGPLDPNDTVVSDFLSTMSGRLRAGLPKAAMTAENAPAPREPADAPGQDAVSPEVPTDPTSADESPLSDEKPPAPQPSLDQIATAGPAGADKPGRSPALPRHGRAMPR